MKKNIKENLLSFFCIKSSNTNINNKLKSNICKFLMGMFFQKKMRKSLQ